MRTSMLVAALGLGSCTEGTPAMYTARPIGLGVAPGQVVADLDGDGRRELVGVGAGTLSVRPLIDGRLAGPTFHALPEVATGLALADVDGDGRLDVVTGFPVAEAVAWASGADLERVEAVAVDETVRSLVAGDIDGDGFADVVATTLDSAELILLRGGPPGLQVTQRLPVGEVNALALADLDGDGRSEVVVSLPERGAVKVFADAGGRLGPGVVVWQTAAPVALAAADLDGDGAIDLAAADRLTRRVWVGFGDGAGGWRTRSVWELEVEPLSMIARRGPAGPELVVSGGDFRSVLLLDPRRAALRARAATRYFHGAPVAVDLEGDGVDELLYGDVVLRDAAGDALRSHGPVGPATGVLLRVDLDGDGRDELVVEEPARGELVVYALDGAALDEQLRVPLPVEPFGLPVELAGLRALARGDGGHDLAWWSQASYGLLSGPELAPWTTEGWIDELIPFRFGSAGDQVLVRTGGYSLESGMLSLGLRVGDGLLPGPALFEGGRISSVVTAQLDDDADDELWVVHSAGVTAVGGDGGPQVVAGAVRDLHGSAATDLDGDGALDLVGCDWTGWRGVVAAHGLGDGRLGPAVRVADIRCSQVHACAGADARPSLAFAYGLPDRDVSLEILRPDGTGWASGGGLYPGLGAARLAIGCDDGDLSLWTSGGRGLARHDVTSGPTLVEQGAVRVAVRPLLGDVDGDGYDELVGDDGTQVMLARADGAGAFLAPVGTAKPHAAARVVELVEMDGEPGKELLVVIQDVDGVLAYATWALRDDRWVHGHALAAERSRAIGDFDGDGRDELLAGDGDTYTLVRPDAAPVPIDPAPFIGLSSLRVADMDGDGRSDLLAAGSPDGLDRDMVLLRSEGAGFAPAQALGIFVTDALRGIGDLDHDGRPDLVVAVDEGDLIVCLRGDAGPATDCRTLDVPDLPPGLRSLAVEDLDGDNDRDLAVAWQHDDQSLFQVFHGDGAGGLVPGPVQSLVQGTLRRARLGGDRPAWVLLGITQAYQLELEAPP